MITAIPINNYANDDAGDGDAAAYVVSARAYPAWLAYSACHVCG